MATLGLLEMLNAAIGTPNLGVVDFVALHKLLEAIIRQLGQQQLSVLEPGQSPAPGLAKDQDSKDQPGQEKEEDGALGTGQQLWKPEEQLEGTGSNSEVSSMAKELMPTTTEEEERAVSKKRASLQHLWEEINKFKEAQCGLAEDVRAMQKAHSGMAEDMREMQEAMQKAHSGMAEDMREMQEAMQKAHSGMAQDMQDMQEAMQKAHSGMAEDMREMQEAMQKAHSGMAQDIQEMKEAHVGLAEDMHALQEAHSGLAEDIQEIQETLGLPGSSSSQATIPGDAQEPAKPWGSTSTSSYESEMREVLSQVGQLGHLCTGLKEQVEQLKSTKAEHADLENLRRLFPKGGRESITSILADLRCQVSFLQDMARALHGEEEKAKPAPAPISLARPKGQKVKAEWKELGKQPEPTQAELEQFAAKYVNKLVMETAQQLQAEVDEPRATVQSGGHEHAGCHFCSPDTRVLLGKLLQRCEKLEEQVESLAQKAGGKVDNYPKWRRQSLQQDEQLKCLQTSIVQLQKGYEKFSSDLANLQQDRQQEQNDVKALSQALGRLEKKQADKEELLVLGIDEKADKAALADKVSRSQLEACVERLTKMMEEVTSRVTGQENGWLQFQKELQRQMDCKKDTMQLSGQDGTDGKRQDEQLSMMGGSQLPTTPTATPETSTPRSQKNDLLSPAPTTHSPVTKDAPSDVMSIPLMELDREPCTSLIAEPSSTSQYTI
ncbi:hypothetical protein Q9966_016597 [Columba livia]|nr:hypothetical protein Q9966_016597 [Columba livia]